MGSQITDEGSSEVEEGNLLFMAPHFTEKETVTAAKDQRQNLRRKIAAIILVGTGSGECSGRLIKCLGPSKWLPKSSDFNLGFFFKEYINNKIWEVPQPQQPMTIQQLFAATVR